MTGRSPAGFLTDVRPEEISSVSLLTTRDAARGRVSSKVVLEGGLAGRAVTAPTSAAWRGACKTHYAETPVRPGEIRS